MAKNDQVGAVFMEEVKILENRDFRHVGRNFDFHGTRPIFMGLTPIFVSAAQQLPIFLPICCGLEPDCQGRLSPIITWGHPKGS